MRDHEQLILQRARFRLLVDISRQGADEEVKIVCSSPWNPPPSFFFSFSTDGCARSGSPRSWDFGFLGFNHFLFHRLCLELFLRR